MKRNGKPTARYSLLPNSAQKEEKKEEGGVQWELNSRKTTVHKRAHHVLLEILQVWLE